MPACGEMFSVDLEDGRISWWCPACDRLEIHSASDVEVVSLGDPAGEHYAQFGDVKVKARV